mgnify:CR=1 FL=1
MVGAQLSPDEVRRIALSGGVHAHPDYHGRQHHVTWEDCVYSLANCQRVAPDHRTKHAGTTSFVSFGRISRSQVIRVDFRLNPQPDGSTILVVTAIPY